MNLCTIIRLVSIVQTQAGTYPTLDPSWYGCTSAMLSALEVNIATVCASLPVFWPVIKENLGRIMVTYEVDVTRETRDVGGFNVLNESGELFSTKTVASKGRQYYPEDGYIREHAGPFYQVEPIKTTVLSPGQCGKWFGRKRPLDLGSDYTADPAGLGQQRPEMEKRESKEGLLKA